MFSIPKKIEGTEIGILFSKFHSHPNLQLILKIRREKINNDKNLLFTLKYISIHVRVCVVKKSREGVKWFVKYD